MKNDLISRQAALNQITAIETSIIPYARAREYVDELKSYVIKIIEDLPSAEPEEEVFEWCHDCKEYDQEKHCCHRWTKVIRQTIEEMKAEPERTAKPKRWDGYSEKGWYRCDCGKGVYQGQNYCSGCGVRLDWGE